MQSIVVDTCVLRLYDNPADPIYKNLFSWIRSRGVLCVSKKLIQEYQSTGNKNIIVLLAELNRSSERNRLITISNDVINSFKDDVKFRYTCNQEDIFHAKLVFVSNRKKLVSQDNKLTKDVNRFKKVNGVKPEAISHPTEQFYI